MIMQTFLTYRLVSFDGGVNLQSQQKYLIIIECSVHVRAKIGYLFGNLCSVTWFNHFVIFSRIFLQENFGKSGK